LPQVITGWQVPRVDGRNIVNVMSGPTLFSVTVANGPRAAGSAAGQLGSQAPGGPPGPAPPDPPPPPEPRAPGVTVLPVQPAYPRARTRTGSRSSVGLMTFKCLGGPVFVSRRRQILPSHLPECVRSLVVGARQAGDPAALDLVDVVVGPAVGAA